MEIVLKLKFDGDKTQFKKALLEEDDDFDFFDDLFYMLDYEPNEKNYHHSKYGVIEMTLEKKGD